MPSYVACIIILAASVVALLLTARAGAPGLHLAVAGLAGLACAAMAIRERDARLARGENRSAVEASTAGYMGLLWIWGSLGLFVTYLFFLSWREWWQFVIAFAVAGALCLGFARLLQRDADLGREDETMLKLGRYLGIAQLVGMIVTVLGLAIDPDKEFLALKRPDWAANNIFLAGALSLAAITAHALLLRPGAGRQAQG
jgi:hypothetical protein